MIATKLKSTQWPVRRTMVKDLAKRIGQEGPSEETIAALRELAGDPKWEVRKEVADHLLLLQNGAFPKLAAMLVDDSNAFVRRAVRRAVERKQRGAEVEAQKRRSLDHIETEYSRFEKRHGSQVAGQARRMAERLYDLLVGATIHDMGNMVTPMESSIVSLQQKLNDHCLEAGDLQKHLPRMRRRVESLNRMLKDMKTYSQCIPSARHRERVGTIIEEAASTARDALNASGRLPDQVCLEIDVARGLTFVVAREHALRAISNLIKNAYEAFAVSLTEFKPGTIRVIARPIDSERLEIIIEDDGQGLSRADLAEVRRFVPGGTTKAGYGTGFGLPTAKRMIEAHGGSLSIDSQDGQGTVVTVTMPITTPGEKP